jgi:exopolysaccharide biosynthesis WecB/TagA/CpsF family protein
VRFFGLSFGTLSLEEAVACLRARPADAPFAYVVTPNADHLDRLRRQPSLRPAYEAAWLRLFDSRCLAHCARLLGRAAPPVVTGADLAAALLPHLAGARVAVIGMGEAAFAALAARYPAIRFRHHDPPLGLRTGQPAFHQAVEFARRQDGGWVFFCVGSPLQEYLAQAVAQAADAAGTGLCLGAALEFAAGTRRRAPLWMRRAGLEWLHRLACEPRRLARRYLIAGPRVVLALARGADASGLPPAPRA